MENKRFIPFADANMSTMISIINTLIRQYEQIHGIKRWESNLGIGVVNGEYLMTYNDCTMGVNEMLNWVYTVVLPEVEQYGFYAYPDKEPVKLV